MNIYTQKQKAAKLAGIAYLMIFVLVVAANFAIYNPILNGSSLEVAQSIQSHKLLFRFGIMADLTYAVGFILLLSSLYFILKDVSSRVAIFAAALQIVYVIVWVVMTLKFFDALRLADSAAYLQVFNTEQLSSLSKFYVNRFDRYYGVLMFYTLGSTLFNFLWYRSGYIPKGLAIWGFLACLWCTFCAVAYLVFPGFGQYVNIWLFDIPMALYDIYLSAWFLTKGLKFPDANA
jgi:hypothetical protein